MPSHHEGEPEWKAPPLSCDSHFHVFGPAERYPYGTDPSLQTPGGAARRFPRALAKLGFERWVFVQPSAYGRDNTCMLDAMRELPGSRGIVDVHEDIPDAELAALNAAGVRGVRINVRPIKPPDPGFSATLLLPHRAARRPLRRNRMDPGFPHAGMADRRADGHPAPAQGGFHAGPHGHVPGARRRQPAGVSTAARLLRHGEGRCWVKLTGLYRMSTAPGFADAGPMMQALVEAAPDRLIWGSDYPHLSFADKVGTVELFNFFGRWVPDEADRRRILVDNRNTCSDWDDRKRGVEGAGMRDLSAVNTNGGRVMKRERGPVGRSVPASSITGARARASWPIFAAERLS